MKTSGTAQDLICGKCGARINYKYEEIIWNAAGQPVHRACFEEPRNLAKPNAQPALSEVLAKIEKKAFWDYVPGRAVRVEDVKEILSEYFA